MDKLHRISLLGVMSLTCAVLTGLAALWVHGWFLPASDGASGQTLFDNLSDPFVLIVWGQIVIGAAVVGFAFSIALLWNVQLTKAFPIVTSATVVVAVLTSPVFVPLAIPASLAAGVFAMVWSRGRVDWKSNPKMQTDRPSGDR